MPELDGLRGIAIGMVLFFHYFGLTVQRQAGSALAYAFTPFRLSWSGVDLFFVLSGFLIGGILLDAKESQNYFRVFYTRRFFRIIPIYFVTLVVFLTAPLFLHGDFIPVSSEGVQKSWIPYFFFLQNFWMAASGSGRTIDVTWSLAVEEQFYLTLPLLIWLLNRRTLVRMVLAIIVGALILRSLLVWAWPNYFLARFVLMPCRIDALMLGVLGALLVRNPEWHNKITGSRKFMRIMLGGLALGLVVLNSVCPSTWDKGMQTIGFTWLAGFYLCVLLYGLTQEGWIKRVMRLRWLAWLGAIAYGVYLFHGFVLELVFGLFRRHSLMILNLADFATAVFALLATIILCRISWVYFEKPLVKRGHKASYEFAETTFPTVSPAPEVTVRGD